MKNALPKTLVPFFWHFIKKQPFAFLCLFLAPIVMIVESNIIPYSLKLLIDGMSSTHGDKEHILEVIAPALWIGGLSWIGFFIIIRIQNFWQGFVIPRFQADIRLSIVDYITAHSYQYFSNQHSGKLATKISDLPKALESIRMILCWNCVSTLAIVVTSLVMLAFVSPLFSWVIGIWVVAHIVLSIYFARIIYRASEANAEDKSTLNGHIVDTLANMVSTKLFARKTYEYQSIQSLQQIETSSNQTLILLTNKMRLWMDVMIFFMMAFLVSLLISFWKTGDATVGDMVLILNTAWAASFHTWFLSHALTDLFREIGIANQALQTIMVPHDLTDAPNAKPLQVSKGTIIFDQVTFRYQRNHNLFNNKSIGLEAGTKIGLVGFSGSGKTTFVNLILRLFDIESGQILIDGQNIARVTQDSLHESISMIPQDTSLFHRTIIENIRYGRVGASDDDVIEASQKAHCHEFISQLPNGYKSLVGERGIKLSGGQRQRIAIARAILKNAPIIILDEATSSLDSITEKYIQEGLETLTQNRTTLVIAHRLSTLSAMDRILVFDKGTIIEDGTHQELLALNGHYTKMWHMQAGGFLPEREVC